MSQERFTFDFNIFAAWNVPAFFVKSAQVLKRAQKLEVDFLAVQEAGLDFHARTSVGPLRGHLATNPFLEQSSVLRFATQFCFHVCLPKRSGFRPFALHVSLLPS